MEDKLELRHIAKFLPFGLKGLFVRPELIDIVSELDVENKLITGMNEGTWALKMFVPIFHPLSDLTKEITHKGETFVLGNRLGWTSIELLVDNLKEVQYDDGESGTHENVGCRTMELLIEHKFDVDNLIEKGLAIDINTLKDNPYE